MQGAVKPLPGIRIHKMEHVIEKSCPARTVVKKVLHIGEVLHGVDIAEAPRGGSAFQTAEPSTININRHDHTIASDEQGGWNTVSAAAAAEVNHRIALANPYGAQERDTAPRQPL